MAGSRLAKLLRKQAAPRHATPREKPHAKTSSKAKRGKGWVFAKRVKIPARPMVPEGAWPKAWADAFDAVADEVIKKLLP